MFLCSHDVKLILGWAIASNSASYDCNRTMLAHRSRMHVTMTQCAWLCDLTSCHVFVGCSKCTIVETRFFVQAMCFVMSLAQVLHTCFERTHDLIWRWSLRIWGMNVPSCSRSSTRFTLASTIKPQPPSGALCHCSLRRDSTSVRDENTDGFECNLFAS
jgi:hypothetical protein